MAKNPTKDKYSSIPRTGLRYPKVIHTPPGTQSYYDPHEETIYAAAGENPSVMQHEMFHHWQNLNRGLQVGPVRDVPITAKNPGEYYNRRQADIQDASNKFLKKNPSFVNIPFNLLYNKEVEPSMYYYPEYAEGEAEEYENYVQRGGQSIFPEYAKGGPVYNWIPPNYPRVGARNEQGGWLEKYANGGDTNNSVRESTNVVLPVKQTLVNPNNPVEVANSLLKQYNVKVDSTGNILKDIGLPSAAYYNPITRTINYKNPNYLNVSPEENKELQVMRYIGMVADELPHAIQADSLGVLPFLGKIAYEGIKDPTNERYRTKGTLEHHAHKILQPTLANKVYNHTPFSSMIQKMKKSAVNKKANGGTIEDQRIPTPTTPSYYPDYPDRTLTNYQMGTLKAPMYAAGSTVWTKQTTPTWVAGTPTPTATQNFRNDRSLNTDRYRIGDVVPTGMDYKSPAAGTYDYSKDIQPYHTMRLHAPTTTKMARNGGQVTEEYKKRAGIPYAINPGISDAGMYVGPTTQRGITFADGGDVLPYITSDPKEFAERKQAYNDSLNLYNYSILQAKNYFNEPNPNKYSRYNKREAVERMNSDRSIYNSLSNSSSDIYGNKVSDLQKRTNYLPIGQRYLGEGSNYIFEKPVQKVIFNPEIAKMPMRGIPPLNVNVKADVKGRPTYRNWNTGELMYDIPEHLKIGSNWRSPEKKADGGDIPPFYVSNPNDPRLKSYNDSLDLFKSYGTAMNKLKKDLKAEGRSLKHIDIIPFKTSPYVDDYKDDKILPIGFSRDTEAVDFPEYIWSTPIYKKPVQPIIYQPKPDTPTRPTYSKVPLMPMRGMPSTSIKEAVPQKVTVPKTKLLPPQYMDTRGEWSSTPQVPPGYTPEQLLKMGYRAPQKKADGGWLDSYEEGGEVDLNKPYLNPAMVQAVLAKANQPVTTTTGRVISTPASREKERREKVIAKNPSKYSIEDYKQGIKEPGLEDATLEAIDALSMLSGAGYLGKKGVELGVKEIGKGVKNLIYKGVDPMFYNPTEKIKSFVPNILGTEKDKIKRVEKIIRDSGITGSYRKAHNRLDAWRVGLGLPQKYNTFKKTGENTFAINPEFFRLEPNVQQSIIAHVKAFNLKDKYLNNVITPEQYEKGLVNINKKMHNRLGDTFYGKYVKEENIPFQPKAIVERKGDKGFSMYDQDRYAGVMGGFRWDVEDLPDNKMKLIARDTWDLHPFDKRGVTKFSDLTSLERQKKLNKGYIPALKNVEMLRLVGGKPYNIENTFIVDKYKQGGWLDNL